MKSLKDIIEGKSVNEARLRSMDDIAGYLVDSIDDDTLYNIIDAIMGGEVRDVRHPGEMLDDEKFRNAFFSKLSDRMINVLNDNF